MASEAKMQSGAVSALFDAFSGGRPPHAVILEGPAGSGKTELALRLARAAVCTGESTRPCGICPGCVKALAGSHPDITVAEGGTAARSFHVDIVRQIRSDAYIQPNEAQRRAFVLLGAHTMSEQAQNALLKVLEEPPDTALFLLTTPAANALLPTVRSRAQLITLEGGSDALPEDMAFAAGIAAAMSVSDGALLECTAPLLKDKEQFRRVLGQLLFLFRDACVLRAGGVSCVSGQPEAAAVLSRAFTREKLLDALEETRRAQTGLKRNANPALLVTAYCAHLRQTTPGSRRT